MKDRIADVRNSCSLSQEEFARRLGVTKSAISGYETGRRKPTDAIIKSICREFLINEDWLRGYGDKMKQDNDVLTAALRSFGCNSFEEKFFRAYFELSAEERSSLSGYLYKLFGSAFGHAQEKKQDNYSLDIESEVDSFRRELMDQKKVEAKLSASPGIKDEKENIKEA